MGALQRMVGVLTSPSKTFEAIAANPGWGWVVPVLLICAGAFTIQWVCAPKYDMESAKKAQMRIMEKVTKHEMTPEEKAKFDEQFDKQAEAGKSPGRIAIGSIIIFAVILLVPGIYRGIAAAFGKTTTYRKLLAGYAYTWTVYLIPTLLTILVAWRQQSIDPNDLQFARLLKSNVGAFLDFDTTSKGLLALLSSVDVFDIWGFIVGSIAVSKMTDFTRKGAYFVVGGVWGFYILIKFCFALFYGMMSA